jgi:hypothetical protein
MSRHVYVIGMNGRGGYDAIDTADGSVPFTHRNRRVVENWIATGGDPEPQAGAVEPKPDSQALTNEVIAHIVNTWGPYEMPRFGLTERVRHIPTGKLCVVMGFAAWAPPILLYSLHEVDGAPLEELTPLSDMAHLDAASQSSGEGKP